MNYEVQSKQQHQQVLESTLLNGKVAVIFGQDEQLGNEWLVSSLKREQSCFYKGGA